MKKLFTLCLMGVLGMGLTTACLVVDTDECSSLTFDEYCSNGGVVECINGIEQISYCNSGYVCAVFDDYNDQAECVIPCDPNYFNEYCDGNTPVWCINGIETYGNMCSVDQTCVEFINGLDRASCVFPEFDEYGGDICDPYYDSNIDLVMCHDGVTYTYRCHETNTPDYYWEPVNYVECTYGCNYAGTDCAW